MLKKAIFFLSIICFAIAGLRAAETDALKIMQKEIKHVVILMLENRSFDNTLAWLYENGESPQHFIPADADPHYLGLNEDTLWQYTNFLKDSSGNVLFSCAPIKGVPSVSSIHFLNSPKFNPHEPFPHVTNQIYGFEGGEEPTMSGFLQDYASLWDECDWLYQKDEICAVMETYTDKELPVFYALARHYAVSDLWFSSVPTQTNPNRAFLFCGTSDGEIVNGPYGRNFFQGDTFWNRFSEFSPQTSWSIFWQGDAFPGIYEGAYSGMNTFPSVAKIADFDSHFHRFDCFNEQAREGRLPDISFIEPQWTLSVNISPTNTEFVGLFENDQEILIGIPGNDLHPPGDVRNGENLLANIYTSLVANPEAWSETLLIITFDEHGGLFDHIPPPQAISPDDQQQNGFAFDRYGVRVPTLFISPKIQRGTVIRSDDPQVPFDHTSIIATLFKWKGIDKQVWNMGNRVAAAPTFEAVISSAELRTDEILPLTGGCDQSLADQRASDIIHMGDLFCLQSRDGQYLSVNDAFDMGFACVSSPEFRTPLLFTGGIGPISHGSFCVINSTEPCLGNENILETSANWWDCRFSNNKHESSQWWTIKSLENPCIGANIHYGDRVYLENLVYLDLLRFVPARLARGEGMYNDFLVTRSVSDEGSEDFYWTIVRP